MGLRLTADDKNLEDQFVNLQTFKDVAHLLELDHSHLIYHLYIRKRIGNQYNKFKISKKSGGNRVILAPTTGLKVIQQKLNYILQLVYKSKPSVHGFMPQKSIVTNASPHTKKNFVFNIDLEDFFPSINFGRVRGLFIAHPYNLPPPVATTLAQICCFEGRLPQGAPTSPIVSNMIWAKMDNQLQKLAKRYKCFYTRYADDITFSTYVRVFPTTLARSNSYGQIEIGNQLNKIIEENGFKINSKKIRLLTKNNRQEVTGLTTNEFPNVKRSYVRQIRSMLHVWRKYGLKAAEQRFLEKYDRKHRSPFKDRPSYQLILKGKIEFLGMVRGQKDPIYIQFCNQLRELAPDLVRPPENPTKHLLEKYNKFKQVTTPQQRGYLLEKLLVELFKFHNVPIIGSFRRNEGAEQIDGAFQFNQSYYLIECKWVKKLVDNGAASLSQKVLRSGNQTFGLLLAINGWSDNLPGLLKQNRDKNIILMNGEDLQGSLSADVDFIKFLKQKIMALSVYGEPFFSINDYLKEKTK